MEPVVNDFSVHPAAELDAAGCVVVLIERHTRRSLGLIEQIFKDHAIALKTGGVDVSQVVGDGPHPGVLRRQPGFTDP